MNEREINPWDMLPADYAGVALTLMGIGFAMASAVQQDARLMIVAAALASVGGVLKVRSTGDGCIASARRGAAAYPAAARSISTFAHERRRAGRISARPRDGR
jgi:hypothetical protein